MKVIDYRIITAQSPSDLSEKVKAAMGFRWQPQGGVCIDPDFYYYQAMILIDNKSQNSPEPVFQEVNSVG